VAGTGAGFEAAGVAGADAGGSDGGLVSADGVGSLADGVELSAPDDGVADASTAAGTTPGEPERLRNAANASTPIPAATSTSIAANAIRCVRPRTTVVVVRSVDGRVFVACGADATAGLTAALDATGDVATPTDIGAADGVRKGVGVP
jgi:hypothetical protein